MDRKSGRFFSAADVEAENFSLAEGRFFFGTNLIDLHNRSLLKLFLDELMHPFNVFQLASVAIWCLEEYYLYAFTIFIISAVSTAITLKETHENDCKMSNLCRFRCKVKLLNEDGVIEVDSTELVPGNHLSLDGIQVCPADMRLFEGDAIVDESMLTGESVPVCKTPGSILYAGTKLVRTRHAKASVIKTGFLTMKGQLLLSILFPKPIAFSFYSDSLKYIYMLAGLAMIGFLFSLYSQMQMGLSFYYIATRALDLITVVLPPALPATLSIGTMFALQRLKKPHRIHCISPSKINVASNIDVVCFDKTGTLTEDGLTLFRVIETGNADTLSLENCMALCHSLQTINDVLVGDPLDKIMFESTGWLLEENQGHSLLRGMVKGPCSSFGILKCFDFCSELRRMSVIGQGMMMSSKDASAVAYCKGSPESIVECCRADSVPERFQATLDHFTLAGFRIIACAGKALPKKAWYHYQREEIEKDLQFLGFLVFENRLKTTSPPVIAELAGAGIPSLMVTGDNLFTAVCVARSCGIIGEGEQVLVFTNEARKLQFLDSDETVQMSELILQPEATVVVCTGTDLMALLNQTQKEEATFKAVLSRIRIFARMSPEDKKLLVTLLQDSLDLSVGFCGDGANDCGALKAADIGISLSDSEASVAAPFASVCKDVSCVLTVLKEGRAALSTSFAAFKFMALYSMIQFTSLLLLYSRGCSLGDNQFVLIDLMLILPLGALMSRFKPADRLSLGSPETKLISTSVLSSLLSQIILQIVAQTYIYSSSLSEDTLADAIPSSSDRPVVLGPANTAIFLFSLFVYLAGAGLFSSWRPFRKFYAPFYGYASLILALTFFLIWIAGGDDVLSGWLELVPVSAGLKLKIILTASLYWIVSFLFEYLIFYFKF